MTGDPSRRTVRALVATTFLQWLGASAMLPLLPLFLRHHGGSDALVGAVMSAFFVAGLVVQYPAGRFADHVGRDRVLLAGLALSAVSTAAFVLPVSPAAYIGLRFVGGAGAAAVSVCALAIITATVPLQSRGRAVGSVMGAQLAGLAIGPLIGSVVGLAHMDAVFVAAAVCSLAACVPAVGLLGLDAMQPPEPARTGDAARPRLTAEPAVRGALVAAAALGLVIGVYEACWTLLLQHRGAHDWQIGLSWTLFAVPFVVMARPAGWLADHFDRRRLVRYSLCSSIAFCCSYPFISSLPALVALGGVEAIGFALLMPSAQSMLTQSVPASEHGRAQGIFGTAETGAIALSALAGAALFAVAPWAPFVSAGVVALTLTLVSARIWSSVPGRVEAAAPRAVPVVV